MKTVLRHSLFFLLLLLSQIIVAQDAGLNIANTEIEELAEKKNYASKDIANTLISNDYTSGGIRHIYYQQAIDNVGLYGTSGAVHLKGEEIIASNLNFLPQIEKRNIQREFQVQALEALARLAIDQGYPLSQTEIVVLQADESAPEKNTLIQADGISNRVIPLKLVYFIDETRDVELAWSVFIDEVTNAAYKNYLVSAATGAVLFEENLTLTCTFDHDHPHESSRNIMGHVPQKTELAKTAYQTDSLYNVVPYTIESPNFGIRAIIANPWENQVASPNGWHHISGVDYQYTIGNNVDAYVDNDNTNAPTGGNAARVFGGNNLVFDYPWDPNGTATDYKDAAVTNLFYINNVAHDILYNYGFDEASGNFQETNLGRGGVEGDGLNAEAQDNSRVCNATMSTFDDGVNPRMQVHLCNGVDADFDNGILLHEYGHGISNRLTGGPQNVECLNNAEQMGEGWSDFFGTLLTMKATDVATTNRTIGTFFFSQAANGPGIRPYPYTTDMTVNPLTYGMINDPGITRPHGVGTVWASMLWDLNWALIDEYGWDADIYNGTGGNNIVLHLVMEGLKLQPCSPGFVDGRDAILAADRALYNGVNQCIIWEVFARRGLGYSADQGSTNSRSDGTQAFDMPPVCSIELKHTVNKANAFLGERLTFQLEAINHLDAIASNILITDTLPENVQFYSASDGGILNGNIVEWPAFNLPVGGSKMMELKVTVNESINFNPDFLDDSENGDANWKVEQVSGNNTWDIQNQYYASATNSWFITNASTTTETHLVLKNPLALTDSSELTFSHYFDLENSYDFGLVDISIDGGKSWLSLEVNFTQNGYNNATVIGYNAFTGKSTAIIPINNGFMTSKVDLSAYAGKVAIIRFRLLTDLSSGNFGWLIDDIGISNTNYALPNFGNIRNNAYNFDTQVETPVTVNQSMVNRTVETIADTLVTYKNAPTKFEDVQANDIDADGALDTLVTTILEAATNGTSTVVNNDSISYVPVINFLGRDTIVYQVCDEANACESDTLFVFVEDLNFAPITNPDFICVTENSTDHFIDVLANDSDPNGIGDTLVTNIIKNASNGTAIVVNEDSLNYSPTNNFFGLDTVIYQACDTASLCTMDTLFITIKEINKAPIAVTDYITISENSTNNIIDVQENDTDPNGFGDSLITTIIDSPVHGMATITNDDSLNYTPTLDYFGLDTIVYQVCDTANLCAMDTVFITIININKAPISETDYLTVLENSTNNTVDVQANDTDANGEGDSLITTILEMPLHGTASVLHDDSLNYTPILNYFGLDTMVYQVCDTGSLCVIDTVFITVNYVNEAPIAGADYLIINKNTSDNFINVQANDSDPDGEGDTLITNIVKMPTNGTAGIINGDSISYTPTMTYFGLDTIIYQVCDTANLCDSDTVFITIKDFNEAPVANPDFLVIEENTINNHVDVQANDSDPNGIGDTLVTILVKAATNGSTIVVNEDSIRFTPIADFVGLDTIVYQVCDTSNLCNTDTLFITVTRMNLAPIAQTDWDTTNKNSLEVLFDVLANDIDPNGVEDLLTTSILSGAFHGVASVDNDYILYTPVKDYFGQDTVVYEVCDTARLCDTDTLFITIRDVLLCTSENLVKNESDVASGNYIAANEIESEAIIKAGAEVQFIAGNAITLKPGFHAVAGADFIAKIQACESVVADAGAVGEVTPITKDRETSFPTEQGNNLVVRPNPFKNATIIDYELATDGPVWIGLYDLTGKILNVLVNETEQYAGKHQYSLSANQLSSGAYWVAMRTPTSMLTKKIIVLK